MGADRGSIPQVLEKADVAVTLTYKHQSSVRSSGGAESEVHMKQSHDVQTFESISIELVAKLRRSIALAVAATCLILGYGDGSPSA
jgi:hypothetical protein